MDYDSFVEIYDRVCPGVPGDVEYFLRRAKQSASVLEVGCGTGRVYLELLAQGIDVVGVDSSEGMLDVLTRRSQAQSLVSNTVCESMINMDLHQSFDLIILAYRTFMHLLTTQEQQAALEVLKRHLSPGGTIIIDLFNPDPLRITRSSYSLLDDSIEAQLVWLWEEFDQTAQIVKNIFRLEMLNEQGETVRTISKAFTARYTFPDEFRALVENAGLTVRAVYADYEEKPFLGTEPGMIWELALP